MPDSENDNWTADIENSLGRDLTATERKQLQAVTDLFEEFDWREAIYPKDLEIFAPDIKVRVPDPAKSLSDDLWITKPSTEYSLLQYIALLLERYEVPLPDFLEGKVETDSIKREILQRTAVKETRLWKNRLSNLSQKRLVKTTQGLEIRLKLNGKTLRWEGRKTDEEPFEVITAKDFGQWLSKDYGFLERFQPNSLVLAALFQEYYKFAQRARLDLDRADDCSFLNKLLHHPIAKKQILDRNELPLSVSDIALQWTGIENGLDEEGCYSLRLRLENGEAAPFPLIYLAGETPLYLHADILHHGPPLLHASENANHSFKIPAGAVEAPEGLLFLRNQGIPLPASVGDNVVCIPMQARLYCKANKPEGENKEWSKSQIFTSHLVAVSPDQAYWFILTTDGWEACENLETSEAAPTVPESTLFEYPPSTYAEDVLEAFDLEEDETLAGIWNREIDNAFANEFVEWIEHLPTEIQLIPDEELDTLVDGRPAGRYALSIDNEDNPDWFNVKLNPEFLDTDLTKSEQDIIMKAGGNYAYLPGKGWKRFEADVTDKNRELLDSLGLQFDDARSGQHALHTLQLADAKLEDTAFEEQQVAIRKRAKEISAKTPTNIPKGIRSELRPYQEDGFKFLAFLAHNQFGGVLADDMGLGKTLQALTWLTWLKLSQPAEESENFRCLVVCPKSVMHVWEQEVKIHSSKLSIAIFDPERFYVAAFQAAGIDILVANYSQLRIHRDFFLKQSWTVSILDEAQYIKNPTSQTAKTARELNSKHRIALTGTPVENRATDLWSIFSYAMPGLLGSKANFAKQYKETDPQTPARLAKRVQHFMIRRSKKQVATDLPDRIEESLVCQMEGDQRDLYMAELKLAQQKITKAGSGESFNKERFNILASLLRLRQICCHPALIDPAYRNMRSAKLEGLIDLVSELQEEGHKVLIFSQFVEMLKIMSTALDEIKCNHLMLTGATNNRQELIDQFQNDDTQTAFLLSLRAAGSGLNLTAASYVVLYDPWWNPAVEAQAIDRTHRIGQKNTVNAYRLIAKDSVEQKIQSLQHKKEALANEIVKEESLTSILDIDNLKYVLSE